MLRRLMVHLTPNSFRLRANTSNGSLDFWVMMICEPNLFFGLHSMCPSPSIQPLISSLDIKPSSLSCSSALPCDFGSPIARASTIRTCGRGSRECTRYVASILPPNPFIAVTLVLSAKPTVNSCGRLTMRIEPLLVSSMRFASSTTFPECALSLQFLSSACRLSTLRKTLPPSHMRAVLHIPAGFLSLNCLAKSVFSKPRSDFMQNSSPFAGLI